MINDTQGSMLGLFGDESRTGGHLYDILSEFMSPYWSVTRSQIYREIAALDEAGLIVKDKTKKPFRNMQWYRITRRGRQAFHDWLIQHPPNELVRNPYVVRMALSDAMSEDELSELLTHAEKDTKARLAQVEKLIKLTTDEGLRTDVAALRYAQLQCRAMLMWVKEMQAGRQK